eukprot:scaffold2265_cov288-Pavlova_lutheri.AAC.1
MDVHSASHIARRLSATPFGGFCKSGRCVSVLGNSTLRLATNHMRDLVVNAYSPRKGFRKRIFAMRVGPIKV